MDSSTRTGPRQSSSELLDWGRAYIQINWVWNLGSAVLTKVIFVEVVELDFVRLKLTFFCISNPGPSRIDSESAAASKVD